MNNAVIAIPAARLNCGHNPVPDGIGTGFATDPATGATACYAYADERQRDALNHATRFAAYVACDSATLTTWSGGHLATIDPADRHQAGERATTPTGHRWTRFTWHATDGDGGRWFGVNGGPGLVVFLRRLKTGRHPRTTCSPRAVSSTAHAEQRPCPP